MDTPYFRNLKETPREMNVNEFSNKLMDIMMNKEQKYAARHLKNGDIPHSYGSTLNLLVAIIIYLVFPNWIADWLMIKWTYMFMKPKD